jgi:hypothetical protein
MEKPKPKPKNWSLKSRDNNGKTKMKEFLEMEHLQALGK